ncbi:hypothetical protein J437_LFUL006291 [Ladona fulva]|uniref:PiggyBac transposable element-derived protein domain-containing protein n=1 Tax=Ladona fulva TaxID=123851 RepID=A0A8K0K3K2_LADFU|nr:hypothetical protein J437_LFUL006291 [Ladona fulva]
MHSRKSIDASTGNMKKKTEIVTFYSATKGGVDTVDKMCGTYSTSRNTRRWPLTVFFHLLNVARVNSFIINNDVNEKNAMHGSKFLREVARELTKAFIKKRASMRMFPKELKRKVNLRVVRRLRNGERKAVVDVCPKNKDIKTKFFCCSCDKWMCAKHIGQMKEDNKLLMGELAKKEQKLTAKEIAGQNKLISSGFGVGGARVPPTGGTAGGGGIADGGGMLLDGGPTIRGGGVVPTTATEPPSPIPYPSPVNDCLDPSKPSPPPLVSPSPELLSPSCKEGGGAMATPTFLFSGSVPSPLLLILSSSSSSSSSSLPFLPPKPVFLRSSSNLSYI